MFGLRSKYLASSQCLLVGIAFCLLHGCSFTDNEQKCKELSLTGLKQYQKKQFAEAEQSYQAAAQMSKNSDNALQYPLMLRELARAQMAQKKFEPAAQNLQSAIDYYDELSSKPKDTRFDTALVVEREYETLASLGDLYLEQHKDMDAKQAFARAVELGRRIVEPPSIAATVNQNYVNVLERTGDHALAMEMQQRIDSSAFTIDEFDERYGKAVAAVSKGEYEGAEKEFERLRLASQKFVGDTARCGKAESWVGFMKLARNVPAEAEANLRDSLMLIPSRFIENSNEVCHVYTLLGLARELQGDTKSSIENYADAFRIDRFLPPQIMIQVRDGMLKLGHPQQAEIAKKRVEFFGTDPRFKAVPVTALDYSLLARQQILMDKRPLARETAIKGLAHLEQNSNLYGLKEMRGAFQLYKRFTAIDEPALAKRALKQLYIVGNRSREGKVQLRKLLELQQLPPTPPS